MNKILTTIIILISSTYIFSQDSYLNIYTNDFNNDISGVSGFNGGTVAHNVNTLDITGSGGAQGAILDAVNVVNTDHELVLDISDLGGATALRVYSQWPTTITDITTTGLHKITFKSDPTNGGFGNKVILRPTSSATVKIDYLSLQEKVEEGTQATYADVSNLIQGRHLLGSNFENDATGVTSGSYTQTYVAKDGSIEATTANNAQYMVFGLDQIPEKSRLNFTIEILETTAPLKVQLYTDDVFEPVIKQQSIPSPGRYSFILTKEFDYTGPSFTQTNGIALSGENSGATFKVGSYSIEVLPENYTQFDRRIQIGEGSVAEQGLDVENREYPVAIGYNANAALGNVAIGAYATTQVSDRFGSQQGVGEGVAVGVEAAGWGWRNTAIGAEANAVGQSTTAIGAGAQAMPSHSIALGRGAIIGNYPVNELNINTETGTTISIESQQLYLQNGWAHKFGDPISGQDLGDNVPVNQEATFNGIDAYDSRYPQWTAGETYALNNVVYQSGNLYFSDSDGNVGNDPTVSGWTLWMADSKGPASDFDVDGGHMALRSGRGTGTGEGGEIRLYTAPTTGTKGKNEKNDPVLSAKIKSDATITDGTDLWLLDRENDTVKRVGISKKSTQVGTKNIIGFSRGLYLIN